MTIDPSGGPNGSLINQGLIGMRQSHSEMVRSAEQVTETTTVGRDSAGSMDVIEPILNMQSQQQVFDSSARVVQTADETLGSLLDTKA